MVYKLDSGRNDLARLLEMSVPLQELLVKGRLLESDLHDARGCQTDHMHWHRKVLSYDPKTDKVLLSKLGSRRLMAELDQPDKEYSREEIYADAERMSWKVREAGSQLF